MFENKQMPEDIPYTPSSIVTMLGKYADEYDIQIVPSLASTNQTLKEMALEGAPHGTVLIAEQQTAGHGRKARTFFSPGATGIYLSVLLRTALSPTDALTITTAAAVAVTEAIRDISGHEARIKWVNDIYMDGKKVCGILTEAAISPDGTSLDYAVLGIGINVHAPNGGFPAELDKIATSIFPEKETGDRRAALAAAVLARLAVLLPKSTAEATWRAYRAASFLPGCSVTVIREDGCERNAQVLDIDGCYRLLVRYDDGTTEALESGEVSIRPEKNSR